MTEDKPLGSEAESSSVLSFMNMHEVDVNPNQRLSSVLLNEFNYLPWSRAVSLALGGRSKLGFINGSIEVPDVSSPTYESWLSKDQLVMSWLLNSMERKLAEIFSYSESAYQLWETVKEMYGSQNNAARVFQLKKDISNLQQDGKPFVQLLGSMKSMWNELEIYRPHTTDVALLRKRAEEDKIFQLLSSLDSTYEDIRCHILMNTELPSFTNVCATIQREEVRRKVMNKDTMASAPEARAYLTNERKYKGKHPNLKCQHCNYTGHIKDTCWILHPELKPDFIKDKGLQKVNRTAHRANHASASTSNGSDPFKNFTANPAELMNEFMLYLQSKTGGVGIDCVNSIEEGNSTALLGKFAGFLADTKLIPQEDMQGLAGSSLAKEQSGGFFPFHEKENVESTLSISVIGASGDLAKKKIFPALFALYYEGFLPKNFYVFGYARTKMTDDELRNMVSQTLTCRIDKRENCEDKMDEFLKRCFYHSGQYNSEEHFAELDNKMKEKEAGKLANRLFYLSIPPNIFVDVVRCASLRASSVNGWTRVIVEKPFGRDSNSSGELTRSLKQYLTEDQIFRIDHYLGKELVENLSVLRFSNLVFEPLWSRNYIRNVQLIFSEDFGTEGRGGYFDNYGIIRDIMQNHLLQILALFAMETPVSLNAEDIRNEKVKVLRSMRPLQLDDVVVGQYKGHSKGSTTYLGYTDDPTVPKDSLTPTFAAAALFINNARWDGVPFLMKAGKALHTKRAEIRVQFRHVPGNLYKRNFGTDLDKATNELVLRVQPDEAIYLKINNKVPGLGMRLDRSDLNLLYRARYTTEIPDAYERLLLDAVEGERRLFIRSDELDASWALFTPLLKELEDKRIVPELYPYGSRGPVGTHYLAAKYNVRWGDLTGDDS